MSKHGCVFFVRAPKFKQLHSLDIPCDGRGKLSFVSGWQYVWVYRYLRNVEIVRVLMWCCKWWLISNWHGQGSLSEWSQDVLASYDWLLDARLHRRWSGSTNSKFPWWWNGRKKWAYVAAFHSLHNKLQWGQKYKI